MKRAAAVTATALAASVPVWPPLVAGQRVVPPIVEALALSVVAFFAATRVGSRGLVAIVGAVLVLNLGVSALVTASTTRSVLPPTHPSRCRVVATESSWMFSASGRLGTVHAPFGFADMQSRYTGDDGETPITNGNYKLTQDESSVTVQLHGSPGNPVWPSLHTLHC
ncbi:hypothetical protein JMX53_09520 [Cutibacterium avidum]|uniref:hypothetical protein n=1 Tax=Cutibacterium avidum TaxID=33010 RepID=UPI00192BA5C7|nr:hypothetical protein [Cutibacterium avidum]QQY14519.1 hypothetical protein JMX53_09520 [Cutibacterium avidum]